MEKYIKQEIEILLHCTKLLQQAINPRYLTQFLQYKGRDEDNDIIYYFDARAFEKYAYMRTFGYARNNIQKSLEAYGINTEGIINIDEQLAERVLEKFIREEIHNFIISFVNGAIEYNTNYILFETDYDYIYNLIRKKEV